VLFLGTPAAAAAHPFGPPSTARVAVDGTTVTVAWHAAEDDWVALGQSLGAFADPTAALTGEQKLERSRAVRTYLLERITVRQDGTSCPGRLDTLSELLSRGARLTFDCPAPVVAVDIRVSALTDINTAYRTVLAADTPATPDQALFTAAQDTQRVRFTGAGGLPGAVVATAVGTGVAAAGVLLWALLRRRRRT
jgi:hypothetical protein